MATERLQKIIARAGVASRRKAEELILAGRVRVDGHVVTELGAKADPQFNRIEVDGRKLVTPKIPTYLAVWKPEGVVSAKTDEFGRKTVHDLITGLDARLFHVGSLDADAEGLMVMTDDGDAAAALAHPSARVQRTYWVKCRGTVGMEATRALTAGVVLEDGPAKALGAHRVDVAQAPTRGATWLEVTIDEGKGDLLKRMLAAIGHQVVRMRRVRFGPLTLEGLRKAGNWRHLRHDEVRKLKALANRLRKKKSA